MCEPATITALAVAASEAAPYVMAASAVAGYVSQSQTASAQEASIRQNQYLQQNQMQLMRTQNDQQSSEKMSQMALESLRETGRLNAMAEIGGVSQERAVNEIQMNAGSDMATLEANRINSNNQINTEDMAVAMRANSQASSIKQPSLIGTGLQIAGGFVDYGTRLQNNRVATARNTA